MIPIKALRLQIGELLAADATYLAPAVNANVIALIAAPFVPSENLVVGDLTYATFTGGAPIVGVTGTQQAGIDPETSEQIITNKEPAGGWRWECTASPALPETIYGFALLTTASGALIATALLPVPLVIDTIGQEINLGAVTMRVVTSPLS